MTPPPDNSDPRDYILDISTAPHQEERSPQPQSKIENQKSKIPFLSIHFKCCNIYSRIYKNAAATAYAGHCPRCHRSLSIPISPTGSTSRIFHAG